MSIICVLRTNEMYETQCTKRNVPVRNAMYETHNLTVPVRCHESMRVVIDSTKKDDGAGEDAALEYCTGTLRFICLCFAPRADC